MRWAFAFSKWLGLTWSAGAGTVRGHGGAPGQARRRRPDTHVRPFGPSLNTRHYRRYHHWLW
jgi:hypothetical protein